MAGKRKLIHSQRGRGGNRRRQKGRGVRRRRPQKGRGRFKDSFKKLKNKFKGLMRTAYQSEAGQNIKRKAISEGKKQAGKLLQNILGKINR